MKNYIVKAKEKIQMNVNIVLVATGLSMHDTKGRRHKEKVINLIIKIKRWHRNYLWTLNKSHVIF